MITNQIKTSLPFSSAIKGNICVVVVLMCVPIKGFFHAALKIRQSSRQARGIRLSMWAPLHCSQDTLGGENFLKRRHPVNWSLQEAFTPFSSFDSRPKKKKKAKNNYGIKN